MRWTPFAAGERPSRRALGIAALTLTLTAAGLRLWVLERSVPIQPLGDEVYYVLVAANLAEGRGHLYGRDSRALRPPAQAWWLSLFADPDALLERRADGRLAIRVERLTPLLRAQVAVGTLLVLATALLGWALFDARIGLAAGAIAAVYPTFVAYSHLLWSETLFATLVTAALAALVAAEQRRRAGTALLAGALFGAAALTREIALPVAGAGVCWAWLAAAPEMKRGAARRGALVLGAAVLVVLPWAARNHRELGRVLPISSVGWIAVGEGNSLDGARWLHPSAPGRTAFRNDVLAIDGEIERADYARRRTLAMIAEQQPGWLFHKLAHNLPLMLSPDAFHLYKLRHGSYGEISDGRRRLIAGGTGLSFALVAGLGAFGIAAAQRDDRRLLALLVLATVLIVHVAANANSRFRMPWMPLIIAYAAHAALGGRSLAAGLSRRERLGAMSATLFVCGVCLSYGWVAAG